MALADWQRALGHLVVSRASPAALDPAPLADRASSLSGREALWLHDVADAPGLKVTAYIARWWRETKLQMMARLTCAALRRCGRERLVQSYLDRIAGRTLFFLPEAMGFLDFIADEPTAPAAVRAIAELERALLRVREPQRRSGAARVHDDVTDELWADEDPTPISAPGEVVILPCPPEDLLGALLTGADLPEPAPRPSFVRVDPTLPQLWAPIDAAEAARWMGWTRP